MKTNTIDDAVSKAAAGSGKKGDGTCIDVFIKQVTRVGKHLLEGHESLQIASDQNHHADGRHSLHHLEHLLGQHRYADEDRNARCNTLVC